MPRRTVVPERDPEHKTLVGEQPRREMTLLETQIARLTHGGAAPDRQSAQAAAAAVKLVRHIFSGNIKSVKDLRENLAALNDVLKPYVRTYSAPGSATSVMSVTGPETQFCGYLNGTGPALPPFGAFAHATPDSLVSNRQTFLDSVLPSSVTPGSAQEMLVRAIAEYAFSAALLNKALRR